MSEVVQIKAEIPRDLKRRAFAAFALRDEKFTRWLRLQLEAWVHEAEQNEEGIVCNDDNSE